MRSTSPLAVFLLGGPGVGKTELRERIVRAKNFADLGSSKAIKDVSASNPHIAEQVRRAQANMNNGGLLHDVLMNIIIDIVLHDVPRSQGIVFDGYPRTLDQIEHALDILIPRGYRMKFVFLRAPKRERRKRVLRNRAGQNRIDDTPVVFERRDSFWQAEYPQLLAAARSIVPGEVYKINAMRPPDVIAARLLEIVGT